nr:GldM family protein [uncultured Psychroserpens sp.]
MKIVLFLLFAVNMSFTQEVALELSRENVIIRGITNPINLAVENTKCENVVITCEDAKITKYDNCNYSILTNTPSRELQINIFKKKTNDTIFVDKKLLRVRKLPDPIPTISGLNEGEVSEETFKIHFSQGRINSYSEYVCISFDVIEYTIIIVRDNNSIGISKNIGDRASEETKQLINLVKAGDKVYIVDLVCDVLNEIRELDEVKFEITE